MTMVAAQAPNPATSVMDTGPGIVWPAQCGCGHLFLEKYRLRAPNAQGAIGFCWCGFCRTKRMVSPIVVATQDAGGAQHGITQ